MAMFKEPIETSTLYFAVPVNNKKATTMLPAVQKIVLDVKALGYPIIRLHRISWTFGPSVRRLLDRSRLPMVSLSQGFGTSSAGRVS